MWKFYRLPLVICLISNNKSPMAQHVAMDQVQGIKILITGVI
jgi:hypothetical protein